MALVNVGVRRMLGWIRAAAARIAARSTVAGDDKELPRSREWRWLPDYRSAYPQRQALFVRARTRRSHRINVLRACLERGARRSSGGAVRVGSAEGAAEDPRLRLFAHQELVLELLRRQRARQQESLRLVAVVLL